MEAGRFPLFATKKVHFRFKDLSNFYQEASYIHDFAVLINWKSVCPGYSQPAAGCSTYSCPNNGHNNTAT